MGPGFQKPAFRVPSPARAIHCLINRLWKSSIYLKLNCWAGHFMESLMCSLMFLSVYSSLSFLAEVFAYLIDQYAPPFLSHICQAGPSLLDSSFLKLTALCLPPPPGAQELGRTFSSPPARPSRESAPWVSHGPEAGEGALGVRSVESSAGGVSPWSRVTREDQHVSGVPLRRLSLPRTPSSQPRVLISTVSEVRAASSPGFIFY